MSRYVALATDEVGRSCLTCAEQGYQDLRYRYSGEPNLQSDFLKILRMLDKAYHSKVAQRRVD